MVTPILKQSCCSCSLKTGSKIISWSSLIFSAVLVISLIVVEFMLLSGMLALKPYRDPVLKAVLEPVIFLLIIIYFFGFVINLLLIYGIYKEKPGYMLPWIILSLIGILLQLGSIILHLFHSTFTYKDFQMLLSSIFACYLILVVYSHYAEISHGGGDVGSKKGYSIM